MAGLSFNNRVLFSSPRTNSLLLSRYVLADISATTYGWLGGGLLAVDDMSVALMENDGIPLLSSRTATTQK